MSAHPPKSNVGESAVVQGDAGEIYLLDESAFEALIAKVLLDLVN